MDRAHAKSWGNIERRDNETMVCLEALETTNQNKKVLSTVEVLNFILNSHSTFFITKKGFFCNFELQFLLFLKNF